MKNKLLIVLLLLFSFFMFNNKVNAEETEEGKITGTFDYYNVKAKLDENNNKYTIRYEFKINNNNGDPNYQMSFNEKIKDSLDTNAEVIRREVHDEYGRSSFLEFSAEENKDYYIEFTVYYSDDFDPYFSPPDITRTKYNEFIYSNTYKFTLTGEVKYADIEDVTDCHRMSKFNLNKVGDTYTYEESDVYVIPCVSFKLHAHLVPICELFGANSTILMIVGTLINMGLCLILFAISKKTENTKIWSIEFIYLVVMAILLFVNTTPNKFDISHSVFEIILIFFLALFYYAGFYKERLLLTKANIPGNKKLQKNINAQKTIIYIIQWVPRIFIIFFGLIFFSLVIDITNVFIFFISYSCLLTNVLFGALLFSFIPVPGENDDVPIKNE